MNKFKLSITLGLLLTTMLGSNQAFAENVKVKIGKFDEGKELIINNDDNTPIGAFDHGSVCSEYYSFTPAYIRINYSKVQPVCWQPARGDGLGFVIPLGEEIDFYEDGIKFRNATLDLDKKKIR